MEMHQTPFSFGNTAEALSNKCSVMTVHSVDAIRAISTVDAIDTGHEWLLFEGLAIQWAAAASEMVCSLLRRDVALRLGQHLVTDLELADGGAAEQGRVKMNMEMTALDFIGCAFQRRLMNTHACMSVSRMRRFAKHLLLTVGELCLEEVIISTSDFCDGFCELRTLFLVEVDKRSFVLLARE